MRITYDQEADILRILLNNSVTEEIDEEKPGVIIDYNDHVSVAGPVIPDLPTGISDSRSLEYAVTGQGVVTELSYSKQRSK